MWNMNMAAMMGGQQVAMAQQMDMHAQAVAQAQMQLQQAQEQLQAAHSQMQQVNHMGGAPAQMQPQQQAPIGAPAAKRPRMNESFDATGGQQQQQQLTPITAPGDLTYTGEVRFEEAGSIPQALMLHGTEFKGTTIGVEANVKSKDGTRIVISNLGPQHGWQDLKDLFNQCGTVLFADIRRGASTPCVGSALFENPMVAQQALALSGTMLKGHQIEIKVHGGSKDGSKLKIYNLPPGLEWQELKDHFKNNGIAPVFTETSAQEAPGTAEVRYEDPMAAQTAFQMLNGSIMAGAQITITMGAQVGNMTTLIVAGIPPGIEWQELKDHFNQVGHVAFCNVIKGENLKGNKGKGKGKDKGGGKGGDGGGMQMGGANMMQMGGMGQGRMLPNGLMISPNGVVIAASGGAM